MIKLKIPQPERAHQSHTFVCVHCRREESYYGFWPERCPGCFKLLPFRGDEMEDYIERRIKYHHKGI